MSKNNSLYAVAALFALVGANVQADAFDIVRPSGEQEKPGGEQTPVGLGFMDVETRSGEHRTEFKPIESLFGGTSGRNYRDNRKYNRAYDDYE